MSAGVYLKLFEREFDIPHTLCEPKLDNPVGVYDLEENVH